MNLCAQKSSGTNSEAQRKGQEYFEKGIEAINKGLYTNGIAFLNFSLKFDNRAYYNLGVAQQNSEYFNQAIRNYSYALELSSSKA